MWYHFKTSDHLLMLWAIPLANSGGDSGAKTLVPPCIRHLSLAGGLTAQAAIFEVPQARAHGQSKIVPPRLAGVGTAGNWHSQESTSISSIESAHSSPRNKIEALKQIRSLALFGTVMPGLWFIKIPSWNTESNETDPLRCKNPPKSSDFPRKS